MVINHLRKSKDPLIRKFNGRELEITKNNKYHSPELSDEENNIIVQNLPWRSDTVSKFIEMFNINRYILIFSFII
jgi:hypothetical protein